MVHLDSVEVLGVATVHSRGHRVSLPKKVRRILDLKPGDEVVFYLNENGEVCIRKNVRLRFEVR